MSTTVRCGQPSLLFAGFKQFEQSVRFRKIYDFRLISCHVETDIIIYIVLLFLIFLNHIPIMVSSKFFYHKEFFFIL